MCIETAKCVSYLKAKFHWFMNETEGSFPVPLNVGSIPSVVQKTDFRELQRKIQDFIPFC